MFNIKALEKDGSYFWTNHSKHKLLQYGLSPGLVKKVINHPERVERGIASDTTASMIRKDGKKNKKEIWVMHQKQTKNRRKIKIISAWIYPGMSPKGKEIFIPEDAWKEIK